MVPKGGCGTFKNTNETLVLVFHMCFYVFFAIWLDRNPWEGGRGQGLHPPPLFFQRVLNTPTEGSTDLGEIFGGAW